MAVDDNPFTLRGKTILITGASSGIGRSIALECSKLGAVLFLTARNEERLKETLSQCEGEDHQYLVADLTKEDDIERLVAALPILDGIVLCAGRGLFLPFKFSTREKFDSVFNINFFSPIETLRLLVKKKKLSKGCSVVFMDSIGGTSKFAVGNSIYGASKAALNSMIKFCALELSSNLIRVNGICPGMVETPLIHYGKLTQEQLDADMAEYPLKRYGQPKDIAFGAIYLLSEASSWMTGQSLVIDGGITIK